MGRVSRQSMFIMMARAASMRATCHRLNVGAIVTQDNSPVSVGWNGAAAGAPHCAGNECAGIVPGRCGTLHAEANALRKAQNILTCNRVVDLYTTHSPCAECMLLIMNGYLYVKRIFFEIPYRSTQHLGALNDRYRDQEDPGKFRATEVYEVTPAGYVVEYFSRRVVELP